MSIHRSSPSDLFLAVAAVAAALAMLTSGSRVAAFAVGRPSSRASSASFVSSATAAAARNARLPHGGRSSQISSLAAIIHVGRTYTYVSTSHATSSRCNSGTRLFSSVSPIGHISSRHSATDDESSGNDNSTTNNDNNSNNNSNTNEKARIVFLGTPEVAATSLQTLHDHAQSDPACPYELIGVVTQPPKRRKRRGKEIPSPVGLVAEQLDIPVLCPEKAKDPIFLDELEHEWRPDLCITAAYGQYLPKRFLATPKLGTLNIHPSLLPRWRGASPVQRSLEAGDQPIGVTVLFTVSKMDAGPIVSQEEYTVGENEQATTVLPHLFDVGTRLLLEALPDVIEGKVTMDNAQQQDEAEVVNAAMIDSSEGELKVWRDDATMCHNKVRGFSMWPGTYMYFRIGEDSDDAEPLRVKILESKVLEERVEPTRVVAMGPNKKDGLRIVCGDGSILEVARVQPATKKAMDAKSFMNGMRGQTLRWVEMPEEEGDESEA